MEAVRVAHKRLWYQPVGFRKVLHSLLLTYKHEPDVAWLKIFALFPDILHKSGKNKCNAKSSILCLIFAKFGKTSQTLKHINQEKIQQLYCMALLNEDGMYNTK